MIEKRLWHQPKLQLLDAQQTAQLNPDGAGTDIDAFYADPNNEGDLPETSETHTWIPFGGGNVHHAQFDS